MFKTEWKPRDEIEYSLRSAERISILSCGFCANYCGTGGAAGIEFLKDLAKEWGKEVILADVVQGCCAELLMREALMKDPEAISRSDALVMACCASGVKAAHLCDLGIPVVAVLDSVGSVVFTDQDNLLARSICNGCGRCVITFTGGICPLAECPAGAKYRPCKKVPTDGCQCGVDTNRDCVWSEIVKIADLAALKDIAQMHKAQGGDKVVLRAR